MLALVAAFSLLQAAPSETVTLPGTHQTVWQSDLAPAERTIQVARPIIPSPEGASLPILITTDGNVMFGLVAETARLMSFEGSAPPMLVVGVSYPDLQSWLQQRQLDYHPSETGTVGVDAFTRSLFEEVVPTVRAQHPDAGDTVYVYGHSSGGLVALTAYRQGWAHGVIASSASLEEEPEWAETLADSLEGEPRQTRLFLSTGSAETQVVEALEAFQLAAPSLVSLPGFTYRVYPEATHMQVIPGALADGLRFITAPAN